MKKKRSKGFFAPTTIKSSKKTRKKAKTISSEVDIVVTPHVYTEEERQEVSEWIRQNKIANQAAKK